MLLIDWIRGQRPDGGTTKATTYEEFAELVGVSHASNVHRWATGKSIPRRRHIQKIAELTGDAVTTVDHYSACDARKARGAEAA